MGKIRLAYGRGTGTPHSVDVHVGARVRMRRTLLGMSQSYCQKYATRRVLQFRGQRSSGDAYLIIAFHLPPIWFEQCGARPYSAGGAR